jgi:hypothetical protein
MKVLKSTLNEHRGYICLAALLLAVLFLTSPATAFSGSGAGTSGDPYQITTISQWNEMQNAPSSYYKLMNDLDWAGGKPTAGQSIGNGFVIDGNFKTLKGIRWTATSDRFFLGGSDSNSRIKNINLHDCTIYDASSAGGQYCFLIGNYDGQIINVNIDNTCSI